ncbi:hypothetical protein LJK88_42495 [Paenibacillus sp. P26]|nr:hypothetical protein LJK88_42495 [Paenibacillus sp. P26]
MTRAKIAFGVVLLLFFGALAYTAWASDEQYLPIALFLVCASMIPFLAALNDAHFRHGKSCWWPYCPPSLRSAAFPSLRRQAYSPPRSSLSSPP